MRTRTTRRTAALIGAALAGTAVVALSGIGASAAGLDLNNGTGTPFHLAKVGPINQLDGLPDGDPLHDPSANGFPYWYTDGTDTLELCLDQPTAAADNCALTGVVPDPDAPITFPQVTDGPHNFPDEAFYWMATGGGDIGTGANAGSSLVVMALEAAFANALPQPGDQMVFARTRLRIDIPSTGQYTVVWPYGKKDFTAAAGRRTINVTRNVGITPGQFTAALAGNIGPFLQWDATPPAAPEGFLGDAGTLHNVTGSPFVYGGRAANFLRIEGPAGAALRAANGANACPDRPTDTNCIEYPEFTVLGKKAVRKGVESTRATYTRTGATTTVDLFGYAAPGSHLQAKGTSLPSTDLDADATSGFYFARLGQPSAGFDPSETIVLRNLTDAPSTRSIVRLTDGVTIDEATYYNTPTGGHAKGDLVVTARSSDDQNTAPLTVVDIGSLPMGGAADGPRTGTFADGLEPGIAAPPAMVEVTSAMGGSASVAVQIVGDASPVAPTTAVVDVTGGSGAAGHAQMLNRLALAGANSAGDYGAWRWLIGTPTSASPGFAAAAHTPTLAAGSLTGVVNPSGPLADRAVKPISVLLPGVSDDNVAHDVTFTLELYPDAATMNAGTGALDAKTVVVHVDAAIASVARLAAVPAAAQRTAVTLDARTSVGSGAFVWQQLDPHTALPAAPAPGGEAAYQAALKALPAVGAAAGTRITAALGSGPTATFTMPDTSAFVADGFNPNARGSWRVRYRVRALSALGAASDSVAVVDVAYADDALGGLDARYTVSRNLLRIRGTSTVFATVNNVKVFAGRRAAAFDVDGDYVGGGAAPALVGQGPVAADGTFDVRLTPANPNLPNGFVTLVTSAGAVSEIAPAGALVAIPPAPLVAIPAAATRVQAAVSKRAAATRGRVRARIVIKAKAKRGNRCALRTTKQVLARKTCGLTQTVFVVTAKRGTVVYVQISGKKQKTVNTKRIRL